MRSESVGAMGTRTATSRQRDAVNDIYNQCCDLVEAAAALRRAAGHPDVTRSAPAILACIEVALRDLTETTTALALVTARAGVAPAAARFADRHARMRQGFAHLVVVLDEASDAAAAARALAARVITPP